MLWTALEDPDPVLIFEHGTLYGVAGELEDDAGPVDIDHAALRRPGDDVLLVTYGGTLPMVLEAADRLAADGVDAAVLDLRTLRPLDEAAILDAVGHTHRVVVVDEGWRSGSISAEIAARITEHAFYELDAPVLRVCSAEVPMPYARHLELAALPSVDRVLAAVREVVPS
jgi:pyruvate dehydrogenase E1 component beta subunit